MTADPLVGDDDDKERRAFSWSFGPSEANNYDLIYSICFGLFY